MVFELKNKIILLVAAFLVSISTVMAAVSVDSVTVTPANPLDNETLSCSFTVSGDEATYSATVTWLKDGRAHTSDDQTFTVDDGVQTTTSAAGDVESSDILSGENWECRVTAQDSVPNSASLDSTAVTIGLTTKLLIKDIDAKCSPSCDDNLDGDDAMAGDAGDISEIKPGADITITFEVENIYDEDDQDLEIQDIELECELDEIEDEGDQDEDIDFGDLDAEDNDEDTMVFEITDEAKDGEDATIKCTLRGEDEDGNDFVTKFDIDLHVEKDDHDVIFNRASVNPAAISCERRFTVDYEVKNIGAKDEDDVQVTIRSTELDIFANKLINELQEGKFDDDDTEFSDSLSFLIDDDVKAGTYPIRFEVEFDDGDDDSLAIKDLIVSDCVEDVPEEKPEEVTQPPVVVIQQPPVTPTQTPDPVVAETVDDSTTEVAFTDSVYFIGLLVAAIVVLLALAIWMISVAVKK